MFTVQSKFDQYTLHSIQILSSCNNQKPRWNAHKWYPQTVNNKTIRKWSMISLFSLPKTLPVLWGPVSQQAVEQIAAQRSKPVTSWLKLAPTLPGPNTHQTRSVQLLPYRSTWKPSQGLRHTGRKWQRQIWRTRPRLRTGSHLRLLLRRKMRGKSCLWPGLLSLQIIYKFSSRIFQALMP